MKAFDDYSGRCFVTCVVVPKVMTSRVLLLLQVRHVVITFYSPFAETVIIERQRDVTSATWQHWQLFSRSCLPLTGYPAEQQPTAPEDVVCKQMVQ